MPDTDSSIVAPPAATFTRRDAIGLVLGSVTSISSLAASQGSAPKATSPTTTSKIEFPKVPVLAGGRIEEIGGPVGLLLEKLSRAHGIHLSCVPKIYHEMVSVSAGSATLDQVLHGAAALFGYEWAETSRGATPKTFELQRTTWVRDRELSLLRKVRQEGAAELFAVPAFLKYSEEQCDRWNRDPSKAPAAIQALSSSNRYYLARSWARASLGLLDTLTPAQWQALLADEQVLISLAEATDRQKIKLSVAADFQARLMERIGKELTGSLFADGGLSGELAKAAGATFDIGRGFLNQRVHSCGLNLGMGSTSAVFAGHFPRPDTDPGPGRGSPYQPEVAGKPSGTSYADFERVSFPAMAAKALDGKMHWRKTLRILSAAVDRPVLSDDYLPLSHPNCRIPEIYMPEHGLPTIPPFPNLASMSLAAGLDALCKYHRRQWWAEAGSILIRSHYWYVEKLYEVPRALIDSIMERLRSEGALDDESVLQLSGLGPYQLMGLNLLSQTARIIDPAFPKVGFYLSGPSPEPIRYLQFYARLSPALRNAVLSKEGLPITAMPPALGREFLLMLFTGRGYSVMKEPEKLFMRARALAWPGTEQKTSPCFRLYFDFGPGDHGAYLSYLGYANTEDLKEETSRSFSEDGSKS